MSEPTSQLDADLAQMRADYGAQITALTDELHRRVAKLPRVKCNILAALYVMQATAQSDGISRDILAGLTDEPLDVHCGQLAKQDLLTGAHDQPYRLTNAGEELVFPCTAVVTLDTAPAPADALALAHAELDQLREELTIYKERVEGEKAILMRIRTAEAKVESAKMALSSEKERLSQAHDELAAFIAQEPGKQQTITFGDKPADDGTMGWFEQGASAFGQGRHLDTCALPLGETRVAWERGWRDARIKACGGGNITSVVLGDEVAGFDGMGDELPVGEKPPADPHTVEHLDRRWLVYRPNDTATNGRVFPLIPLYTKDEWNQLHADTYGNAVAGFDQDTGARDRRQKGGIDCGRVVKVGRKSLVVGPLSDACYVEVANETEAA